MSADLLAEFDSFYTAPQNGTSSSQSFQPVNNPPPAPSSNRSFGGPPQTQQAPPTQWTPAASAKNDIWGDMSLLSSQPAAQQKQQQSDSSNNVEDDPWGTFETPVIPQSSASMAPTIQSRPTSVLPPPKVEGPKIVRRSTLELFSAATHTTPVGGQPKKAATEGFQTQKSNDILFDAEDENTWGVEEEDEDDFGDFETGTPTEPPVSAPSAAPFAPAVPSAASTSISPKQPPDLLSAASSVLSPPLPYPQAPRSPSFHERNPFSELSLSTVKKGPLQNLKKGPPSASPVTAWPTYEPKMPAPKPYVDSPTPNQADDEWGDFADLPPETPDSRIPTATVPSSFEADSWSWDAVDSALPKTPAKKTATPIGAASTSFPQSTSSADASIPTNIPPPSVILPVFGQLFGMPNNSLFQPVANQKFSLKNVILSDPTTITFLRSFVLLATVAARIIAGRKLRWKRDTILSQSMKIGPSAAGGKGGMKLTGVDKAETKREDREAEDLVRIWKEQLGRLKSAVAIANTSIKDQSQHLSIPEINENMVVRTASSADGALTAPKCCILCGLKREERVVKVDFKVEDSFGDWWTEHWGHRACKNFWTEHEGKLKQR